MNHAREMKPGENPLETSAKLLEAENSAQEKIVRDYQQKIMKVVEEIRAILMREDMRVGDWATISQVMDKTSAGKINQVKFNTLYGKETTESAPDSGSETNGGAEGVAPKTERRVKQESAGNGETKHDSRPERG